MIIVCFLTMEEKYKTNGIFPKLLPDCDINQRVILVNTISHLHPAHSEDFYHDPV